VPGGERTKAKVCGSGLFCDADKSFSQGSPTGSLEPWKSPAAEPGVENSLEAGFARASCFSLTAGRLSALSHLAFWFFGGQGVSTPRRYNSAELNMVAHKGLIKTRAWKLETGELMLGLWCRKITG